MQNWLGLEFDNVKYGIEVSHYRTGAGKALPRSGRLMREQVFIMKMPMESRWAKGASGNDVSVLALAASQFSLADLFVQMAKNRWN
jgi:hypothetical protein